MGTLGKNACENLKSNDSRKLVLKNRCKRTKIINELHLTEEEENVRRYR